MEHALIVRRWRRYGADRLYVTAGSGTPLGSVDLVTGQVAVEAGLGGFGGPGGFGGLGGPGGDPGAALEAAVRGAAQAFLRADLPELVVSPPALPPEPPSALAPAGGTGHRRGRRARTTDSADAVGAVGTLGTVINVPAPVAEPAPHGRHRADDLVRPCGDGEPRGMDESLCDRLDRLLLDGWHVLHDVPVGRQGSVVAHLLVGPPGAFAVAERPADPGPAERFTLDGRYLSADGCGVSDLRDVRLSAARAGSLMRAAVGSPVAVRGVLVVHGPVDVLAPSPYDAVVVGGEEVPHLFAAMTARWTTSRVDAVAAVARRHSTWALTRVG